MQKRLKAEAILLFVTTIWGTTFVATKIALQDITPILYLAVRFGIASIIFLIFFYKKCFPISKKFFLATLPLILWYYGGFIFQTIGLSYTTASKSGLITGCYVVVTPFLQSILQKKTPPTGVWVASIIVFVGLYFLTTREESFESDFNVGDLLTLLCGVCYAFYIVELDKLTQSNKFSTDDNQLYKFTFLQLSFVGLCSFPLSFILESPTFTPNANFILIIMYLAFFASSLTTLLQTRYQKDTTPSRAAIIFIMESVVSVAFAVWFLGESLSGLALIGAMMMIIGLIISEKS